MARLLTNGYRLEYKKTGSSAPCDLTIGIFANKRDAHKHARETVVKRGYLIYTVIGVGSKAGFEQSWTNSELQPVIHRDVHQTMKWKLLWSKT